MILNLKREITKKNEDFEDEIKVLKQEIEKKDSAYKKLKVVNSSQKQQLNKLENEIKNHLIVNEVKKEYSDKSESNSIKDTTEKRPVKKNQPSRDSSQEKDKHSKKITDTGSSYPNEPASYSIMNNKSEEDIIHEQNKTLTIPPPSKDLSELESTLTQFRSILRISNVGVKEFLDLIVFKDQSSSIKFSDFKLRVQEIMKNYTQDFA
jgi:hypothetical protein